MALVVGLVVAWTLLSCKGDESNNNTKEETPVSLRLPNKDSNVNTTADNNNTPISLGRVFDDVFVLMSIVL